MRKVFLFLMLVCCCMAGAQNTDSIPVVPKEREWIDSASIARDIENNNRNLNNLVHTINERNQKEKQRMWLRLGFGAAILGIGAYGLLRKRKTAK